MTKGWRERILEAVEADERSDRAISLAAKLGPNFVNELRNTRKQPRADKLLKLIDELKISATYVFTGLDFTPEDELFVQLLRSASPADRALHLDALKSRQNKS